MEKASINNALNIVKGIACIFVVLMHCEFPGKFGVLVQCVSRFAVPFFFAVSGYFCFYPDDKKLGQRLPFKIKHIAHITLASCGVYIIWFIIKIITGVVVVPPELTWWKHVLILVLFNQPLLISGHLWFLFALLYAYILMSVVYKNVGLNSRYLPIVICILLVMYFAISYGAYLLGIDIPNCIYRNFFFEGFPLMLLGYYFHKKQEQLLGGMTDVKIWVLLFIGIVLSVTERWLLGRDFGMHVGSILTLLALLYLSVQNSGTERLKIIRILGEKYSLWVYVAHMLVWDVVYKVAEQLHYSGNTVYLWLQPIIVVASTIISGIIFYWIKDRLKDCHEYKYSK